MVTVLRNLLVAGVTLVAGCQSQTNSPLQVNSAEQVNAPMQVEIADQEQSEAAAKRSARGVLQHYPLDVKGVEAWLGHEFLVGMTPVRATDAVSRDTLLKMVGEYVEVDGRWNPGEEWEPPTPDDEEFCMQHPTGAEFEKVVLGASIEVTAIVRIED
ncbi:MAG: hypothetical protein ACE361_25020 [Aureliella sp.]